MYYQTVAITASAELVGTLVVTYLLSDHLGCRFFCERRVAAKWVLVILWALGLVSSYTLGGFIHILLVIAIAVIAMGGIQGRRS